MKFDSPLIIFFRYLNIAAESEECLSLDWELLIRQARAAGVLSRVAFLLNENGLLPSVPDKPKLHFQSALLFSEANSRSVLWEIEQLKKALNPINADFIMLKGAAYVLKNCAATKGRVFSDIDIMVRKPELGVVEKQLVQNGWVPSNFDAYDQNYYRLWMHEIPPMKHISRQTNLDVHHTILPPTVGVTLDVDKLWQNVQAIEEQEGVYVLSLPDMIIHSATHLFYDGELEHGFRDISDLDLLFKEFTKKGGSWTNLVSRANELRLSRPLYYAIRYCVKFLDTPIPEHVITAIEPASIGSLYLVMMDCLFFRALMPDHASCDDRWTGLARWLLYMRSHWLRMPLYLLVPHLSRKAWLRLTGKESH